VKTSSGGFQPESRNKKMRRSSGPFYPEPRNEKAKKVRGTFLASCPEIKKQEEPPVEVFSFSP